MNLPTEEGRRTWFRRYEELVSIWAVASLQAYRLNYAKELFREAMALRLLREANHPVWLCVSGHPWLLSQRDVELWNKAMQGHQRPYNIKMETDVLR